MKCGMCLNWKVWAGLGVGVVAILILAPGLKWAVLPLLLLAACPLIMLLMGLFGLKAIQGMRGGDRPMEGNELSQQAHSSSEERLSELKALRERVDREIRLTESEAALGQRRTLDDAGELASGPNPKASQTS